MQTSKSSTPRLALSRIALLTFFLSFAWSVNLFAQVELLLWSPRPDGPRIILPHFAQLSPEQSLARYLTAIKQEPGLASLRNSDRDSEMLIQLEQLPTQRSTIQILNSAKATSDTKVATKVSAGINSNQLADMVNPSGRGGRVTKLLNRNGAEAFLIALAAEVHLKPSEVQKFHKLLTTRFQMMVSLGGTDIHPKLYNQEITHSVNPNLLNDSLELSRVKAFKAAETGVFMGFCRGHQMGAIADGHELYQDIEKEGAAKARDHARLNMSPTAGPGELQTWHHVAIEESLLKRFLKSSDVITNSVHHQAVKENPDGKSFGVAFSGNIVEALQMKNGLGISFQFHPEFPKEISGNAEFSKTGESLIRSVISYSRLKRLEMRKLKCSAIFSKAS